MNETVNQCSPSRPASGGGSTTCRRDHSAGGPAPIVTVSPPRQAACASGNTFAQTFRWRPSTPTGPLPGSVEVVGSLTNWRPIPLAQTRGGDAWQVIIQGIPGNRTHRYVMLVDGKPTFDSACDGLSAPQGPREAQFQVETRRGPRLCMLFSNTK